MTRTAPCPACSTDVDALAALDNKQCPECHTPRWVLYLLADGDVTHDDLQGDEKRGFVPTPEARAELEAKHDDLDDPADENSYLREMGVAQ